MLSPQWSKSSYSTGGSANCVEVAAAWHTSGYSSGSTGNRLESRTDPDRVLVRDTRHRRAGHLDFTPAAWARFLAGLRRGEV